MSAEDWDRICREFPSEAESEGERRTLFALWAAKQALSDAGVAQKGPGRSRFGVALGSGLGINRLEDIHNWLSLERKFDSARFAAELDRVNRESIIRNNASEPAALISGRFGLNGMNTTVTTACASATQAIGTAYRAIKRGEADLILAGGADSMINPVGLVFFALLGSAAVSKKSSLKACAVLSTGKGPDWSWERGRALPPWKMSLTRSTRGAIIYAEVAGYASTMDAWRLTAPHPEGRGAEGSHVPGIGRFRNGTGRNRLYKRSWDIDKAERSGRDNSHKEGLRREGRGNCDKFEQVPYRSPAGRFRGA